MTKDAVFPQRVEILWKYRLVAANHSILDILSLGSWPYSSPAFAPAP